MSRVVLAMSGGVDSSVAAWLLAEQGHEVVGVFMRHGVEGKGGGRTAEGGTCDAESAAKGHKQGCWTAADAADARRVAEMLGIPFYALNFEAQFGRILDYFADQYAAGRTPNPCIVCNTWLKFGKLFEYADSVGAQYVATGHHARIVPELPGECSAQMGTVAFLPSAVPPAAAGGLVPSTLNPKPSTLVPALCRARDAAKDQSYVLFGIDRRRLGRLMLPVGEHSKDEIRRIAGRLGLRVAGKPDSQEICFVPDGDHARLVHELRPGVDASGEIVTAEGRVVGRHSGLAHFTVGQRKGLGVAFGDRRYVIRLEPDTRRVVVGTREELARQELTASDANWLVDPPSEPFDCQVKIRYRSRPADARVEPLSSDRFRVRFAEPCHGVAPGQAAVCYQSDRVLGGGWIE